MINIKDNNDKNGFLYLNYSLVIYPKKWENFPSHTVKPSYALGKPQFTHNVGRYLNEYQLISRHTEVLIIWPEYISIRKSLLQILMLIESILANLIDFSISHIPVGNSNVILKYDFISFFFYIYLSLILIAQLLAFSWNW